MPALPITTDQIVITASRAPESQAQSAASTTIIDGQTIELEGNSCEAIKSGDHMLSARFPCNVVVTPPIPK